MENFPNVSMKIGMLMTSISGHVWVWSFLMALFVSTLAPAQTNSDASFSNFISGLEAEKVRGLLSTDHPLGWCDPAAGYDYISVRVRGLRAVKGNIRMSLYGSEKKDWLARGKKLVRFDVAVTGTKMTICMPLPFGPGTYGVGTYHDENANTDFDFWSEGYGVSNNGKRGFLSKPSFKKAAFQAQEGRTQMSIYMRY